MRVASSLGLYESKVRADKTHLFLADLCFLLGWLMSLSNPLRTGLAAYGQRGKRKKQGRKRMRKKITQIRGGIVF